MLVSATAMAQVILYGSYIMWLMMPYLTEVWGMSIVRAAAVVNIFDGLVAMLPLGFKILLNLLGDSMIGDYYMLLWSGISSTLGLLLITMSTPSVLSKASGVCSEYEPHMHCISHTKRNIFYAGLVLLATGMATSLTSLRPYIFKRANRMGINKPEDVLEIRQSLVHNNVSISANSCIDTKLLRYRAYNWPSELWLYRCNGAFTVLLVVLVLWVKPWSYRLGIPTIILFATTLLFVAKPWYRVDSLIREEEQVSNERPRDGKNGDPTSIIKTMVKSLICNFPMWCTFVICGLVSSGGNTYFMEQAGQMDPKLGHWEVPTAFFFLFYRLINYLTAGICQKIISSNPKKTKHVISFALVVSIVCCVVAALVEKTRLDVVKKQGLFDKSEDPVPLSMFLMVPQFFLLGILDAAYNSGVFAFFHYESPKSAKNYLNSIIHFVLGLGILCNVASVYLAGKVSGKGSRHSWFQHTLNRSHLDYYYWMLALLSAINLFYYILVGYCYSNCQKPKPEPDPDSETEGLLPEHESETEEVEELEFVRLDWFDLLPLRQ